MDREEFGRALKESDFKIGDSFWLRGIKFEVINTWREMYESRKRSSE